MSPNTWSTMVVSTAQMKCVYSCFCSVSLAVAGEAREEVCFGLVGSRMGAVFKSLATYCID